MKKEIFILVACIAIILALISLLFTYLYSGKGIPENNISSSFNGIVTNIWLEEKELEYFRARDIRYLFVDIGTTENDGKISTPRNEINGFLNLVKKFESKNNFNFVLIPYCEINTYDYELNPEFLKNYVNEYKNLDSIGFDGILVDIEPVQYSFRKNYIVLLDNLRQNLSKGSIISVYSGTISDNNHNEWEWDYGFYRAVSEKVDIISMQGYDTGIRGDMEYQNFIGNQIKTICNSDFNKNFLYGIPTHNPKPETIENALHAYNEEIRNCRNNKFLGVNLFASWTISQNDWEIYDSYFK